VIQRALVLALTLLALAPATRAGSRVCGDDVDGRGTVVPCSCGDLLVSSRTLSADDPITQETCTGPGLLVGVPTGRTAPTLALGGRTITGSGHGAGLLVASGGDGGLTLLGPGTVRGFASGIVASPGALTRAADVVSTENRGDGFDLGGTGYAVTGCEATRNGRDGFALRGRGFHVEDNQARENQRYGFSIAGRDAVIGGALGNQAIGNGRDGLAIRGRDSVVERPVATANGRSGLRARIARGRISGAQASANRGAGVQAGGSDVVVSDSDASGNGGPPVRLRGTRQRSCGPVDECR